MTVRIAYIFFHKLVLCHLVLPLFLLSHVSFARLSASMGEMLIFSPALTCSWKVLVFFLISLRSKQASGHKSKIQLRFLFRSIGVEGGVFSFGLFFPKKIPKLLSQLLRPFESVEAVGCRGEQDSWDITGDISWAQVLLTGGCWWAGFGESQFQTWILIGIFGLNISKCHCRTYYYCPFQCSAK